MTQRFNRSSFFHADILRRIDPANLVALLAPHGEYLEASGFRFPGAPKDNPDYRQLALILLDADEQTPADLVEALHVIGNMEIEERIDDLLEIAVLNGVDTGDVGITPLDLAVRIWLKVPRALEKKERDGLFEKKLKFEHFPARVPGTAVPVDDLLSDLNALEADLDRWFQENKRGPGANIQQVISGTEARFLIDHGQPCRRERNRKGRESSWLYFRPEKTDVVIYDAANNELRVRATTLGEMRLYVAEFGKHLFGDEQYFVFTQKYTLAPLQDRGRKALNCRGIDGLESVRLREVQWLWDGAFKQVDTHRASDLFEAFAIRGMTIPKEPTIQKAVFEVKLAAVEKPRLASIRIPNTAAFGRGEEALPVEQWLRQQGFILLGTKAEHEEADEVLACV